MQSKKPINIQIGQNIRQIREDAGLTQERLADILGIGDKHVSAIERGAVGLSLPTLMRICEALSVLFGARDDVDRRSADIHMLMERLERLPDRQFSAVKDVMDAVLVAVDLGGND